MTGGPSWIRDQGFSRHRLRLDEEAYIFHRIGLSSDHFLASRVFCAETCRGCVKGRLHTCGLEIHEHATSHPEA